MLILFIFTFLVTKLNAQVFIPLTNWNCHSQLNVTSSGDQSNADFAGGTFSNTVASGASVSLAVAATSGTFTSRTFDVLQTCGPFNQFSNFSWKSSMPFLKELPTTSESIVDYPAAATTLQTNLIGYWRLNEATTGTVTGGKDFEDFSGNGFHAVKTGAITLGSVGRFVKAVSAANGGGYVDLPGAMALIGSTSSYTISVWYKISAFTNGCGGSGTYLLDRALSGGGNPLAGICTKSSSYSFETRCNDGSNLNQVIGPAVVLNTWQNVVIQRDRSAALYRIFGNGIQINTNSDAGGCAVTLDPPRLGRHATGTTQGMTGSADEVMIWNRALTATEILQVYRRGGNRVEFQYRACTSNICADNPAWVGPDGTATQYFSELNNNSVQATSLGNVLTTSPSMGFTNFPLFLLPRNRYFQYRAFLNSDSTANTPDFNSTLITW